MNNKFKWNYMFKTPYDYVEMFITIGLLLESDSIVSPSLNNSPASDVRGGRLNTLESRTDIAHLAHQTTIDQSLRDRATENSNPRMSPHSSQDILSRKFASQGASKPTAATPSTFNGLVLVSKMEVEEQIEVRRLIRTSALNLIDFISSSCQCSPLHHKVIAYAAIAYARKLHRISDYE